MEATHPENGCDNPHSIDAGDVRALFLVALPQLLKVVF